MQKGPKTPMPRKQTKQPLSKAEWEIMNVLWEHGDMALGEVVEKLDDNQPWAYTTVKTFLRRMVEKGWITDRKVGGSYLYRAKVTKRKAVGQAVSEFSQRVLDGILTPFVAYYAEDKGLSEQEIAELQQILDRSRKEKGRQS